MNRGCVANAAGVLTGGWFLRDPRARGLKVIVEPGGQVLIFPDEAADATCEHIVSHLHLWTMATVVAELGLTPVTIAADLPAAGEGQKYHYDTGTGEIALETVSVTSTPFGDVIHG